MGCNMSDVAVHRSTELALPIVRTEIEEDEEYPHPRPPSPAPIHALQLFFLLYLIGYLLISWVFAMESGNFSLFVLSSLSIMAPLVGKRLEKKYQNSLILRRKIATGALGVEIVLLLIWQICIFYLIG